MELWERMYVGFMLGAIAGKLWGVWSGILFCVVVLLISVALFGRFSQGRRP